MVLATELLREVASYICIAACTLGENPKWTRDQAAVGGNMVRLYKLLWTFLDQTCQKHGETSLIISRLIFETLVNVRYLMANHTPALVDSYIKYSLRHERKLLNEIEKNISDRQDEIQPIEERMIGSIQRTAQIAAIDLNSIDLKDKRPWGNKNLFEKSKSIGLDQVYEAFFGGQSHFIHGAWQDLHSFHLKADSEGGFTPRIEWARPRPQVTLSLGLIVLDAAIEFIRFIGGISASDHLNEKIIDLRKRIIEVDDAHEVYLQKKT
jgi:hypothetical protein